MGNTCASNASAMFAGVAASPAFDLHISYADVYEDPRHSKKTSVATIFPLSSIEVSMFHVKLGRHLETEHNRQPFFARVSVCVVGNGHLLFLRSTSLLTFHPGELNKSEQWCVQTVLWGCACHGHCQCDTNHETHFPKCDFTKFFSFCGQRLPLCIFACTQGEFEIGLLMLETLSPEDAQKMTTCFNFTLMHMMWKPMIWEYGSIGNEEVVLLRQKRYAEYVVLSLGVDVNAQITNEYNDYQGQHPEDYEEDREEEYNPMFEDLGGLTPVMNAIKRHSYGMAAVLGDLGADWHTLANADGHTAYEMLLTAAKYEDDLDVIMALGPNASRIPFARQQVKRTIRSLLRLHDPKR